MFARGFSIGLQPGEYGGKNSNLAFPLANLYTRFFGWNFASPVIAV
jgi:hypothetical protein